MLDIMSYRNDLNQYKALTMSLIKSITHSHIFYPMSQKYPAISVNAGSLLPFIDEFVHQGLISQISVMLFLKNTSIKGY